MPAEAMEALPSLAVVRINGRVYPAEFEGRCKVCRHPDRYAIEYMAAIERVSAVGVARHFVGISRANITNHFSGGHSPGHTVEVGGCMICTAPNRPVIELALRQHGPSQAVRERFITDDLPLYPRTMQAHMDHFEHERPARVRIQPTSRTRWAAVVRRYGMTLDEYDALVLRAEGRCEVCGDPHRKLHIDHCHETGRVRGLLCPSCNRCVDRATDLDYVRRATAYVQQEPLAISSSIKYL